MPGPVPKPAGQRRRRNATTGQRVLPREGYAGPVPELPGDGWLPFTVEWWQRIWRSPMAVAWAESDASRFDLAVCARMKQEALLGDTKAAAEARQIEDRYGLSPLARRKLEWELEADPAPIDLVVEGPPAAPAPAPAPATDPRRLRAIAGGAGRA
jgi:hypothetical protein